jgi:leucyl aminopeptidase
LSKDRKERHSVSQSRTANWKYTIAENIKTKLEERNLRLDKEEHARQLIDLEYHKEKEDERLALIKRAKDQQYLESDLVKNLHSNLNNILVYEEREMQIKLKHERRFREYDIDVKLIEFQLEKDKAEEQKELLKKRDAKLKRIDLAKAHVSQMKEKELKKHNQSKVLLIYTRKILNTAKHWLKGTWNIRRI